MLVNQVVESSSGRALFDRVLEEIFSGPDSEKLRKNFARVVTNGGPTMLSGKDKDLSNRLRNRFPDIIKTPNYCHLTKFLEITRQC